ncbi:MAG: hypothetical protein QF632_06205 [Candidatus Woesearchaeota archaeon]|jgi:hypothetical protein|nr:hypothetical protein [Candidatus Woesearchaeota archaeon]MDP7324326.1 hypothetical protein [Candidatus Woesearchaeota archaeon]MDP7458419.1 hypothetical protein [Candidatus Woesearchaeota archaeon]|tara:strand:+ start:80 stop:355 length:276 start_codon:yes stop_codon:yes gene_type:complete
MENIENKQPEMKFRAGAISATIWSNAMTTKSGEPFEVKSIQVNRAYKDKQDEWQNTGSFRTADLPKVKFVLDKAYEYLVVNTQKPIEDVAA